MSGLLAWASALIVLVWWIHGGGLQDLTGTTATALTTTGRLTGLVAADLMLVQVALMARIPFVERSYGQVELAGRHRLVGFWSFWLMIAHVVLTVLGYAAAATTGVLATGWDMLLTFPGMLIAWAGTGLMLAVVATSIRAARRRLRYESWHLIHLYGYLGAGLAVPHMVWTGADFTRSPLAQAYWWTVWALVMAAVLVFRVALPVWRSRRHGLVVERVIREGPDVVSVHLRGRDLLRLPVDAGSYFVWRFAGEGWTRGHPISLSAAPTSDRLRITARVAGDGTSRMARLTRGTRVTFEGPYGRLTQAARTQPGVVLLGSGIGITPMRALLEGLTYAPGHATLIHRARSDADLVLRAELHEIAARRGAEVIELPGPRVQGRRSWLPQSAAHLDDAAALAQLVPDIAGRDVYICGPDEWIQAARTAAVRAGVPSAQIHTERFSV